MWQRWSRALLGLARRRTRCLATAEDLVQDTVIRSLMRGENQGAAGQAGPLQRQSLQRQLRDLEVEAVRARGARLRAEFGAPRSEPEPETAEVVASLEQARLLRAAVEALPEPYRAAVQLRYFDGLDSHQIARRLGIRPATARKRSARGVDLLRHRLTYRDYLALLAVPMKLKTSAALPAALLAGLCVYAWLPPAPIPFPRMAVTGGEPEFAEADPGPAVTVGLEQPSPASRSASAPSRLAASAANRVAATSPARVAPSGPPDGGSTPVSEQHHAMAAGKNCAECHGGSGDVQADLARSLPVLNFALSREVERTSEPESGPGPWNLDGGGKGHGVKRAGRRTGFWTEFDPGGQRVAAGRYHADRRHGEWTTWHPSGAVALRGRYIYGLPDGAWRAWRDDGSLQWEAEYAGGQLVGAKIERWEGGAIRSRESWVDGVQHGASVEFDRSGRLVREQAFADGKLVRDLEQSPGGS